MPVLESGSSSPTFVLDLGAGQIKAGLASGGNTARVMPNCVMKARSEKRRAFIADQIDDCRDLSALFYILPFQRGYLVNWDTQKTIWDYLWGKSGFNIDTEKKNLIITEPYFNFASIQEGLNEILFEEYKFQGVFRTTAADLCCYKNRLEHPNEPCCVVVDMGYSFTHVVPFIHGKRQRQCVKRIDVGGKLLTNHLKEIISYRQLHVLDETYVMNCCREDCCYVSTDFYRDLREAEKRGRPDNQIARDYVLPDFTSLRRGYMKSQEKSTGKPDIEAGEQILRMNHERFTVPEVLFNPSDIGIQQAGIAESIIVSVMECPEESRGWLFQNIVLAGGLANTRGMQQRLEKEIRELAPDEYDVTIRLPSDPVTYAWSGGAALARDPAFKEMLVTRADYLDRGHVACEETFLTP